MSAPPLHDFALPAVAMDTGVIIRVRAAEAPDAVDAAMRRALHWFAVVEDACSRFDPRSEIMRLVQQVNVPVPASPIVLELVDFALSLAQRTAGAFDPTVGRALELQGFNQSWRSGLLVQTPAAEERVSYQDVRVDRARGTITLRKPLVLDLGAVAKGMALDLAARELNAFAAASVEAGGDIIVRGPAPEGQPWTVGIRHPRQPGTLLGVLPVGDTAVCTSGDYERRTPSGDGHHLLDARTRVSARELASVTVLAPTALAADGLSTAAFVLGADRGRRFLEEQGVQALLVTPDLTIQATGGLSWP